MLCKKLHKPRVVGASLLVDAVAQLLIEKGVFTEQEFFGKLKEVQYEYESRGEAKE